MGGKAFVIAYDVGTTSLKSCLFRIGNDIRLVGAEMANYELTLLPNGGAEQDPEDWWRAMAATTRTLLQKADVAPEDVGGISFCSQMQGLVLVDEGGDPVRPMMSYMDQRAVEERRAGIGHGLQVEGMNVFKLLRSLYETGAVAASVKDPVWKYKWVEKHEPERFRRVHKWLDVKEWLLHRCTGVFAMTEDSAFATLLYAVRSGRRGWSRALCRLFGVNMDHLPDVIGATERVGGLTEGAAVELGLAPGTPVFAGGGDASLVGVGAGATELHDTHVYMGTSGWVSTVVDRSVVDTTAMIAAIVGARPGLYNYFAELETAGKCLEWVRDHLALDEIGVYLEKVAVHEAGAAEVAAATASDPEPASHSEPDPVAGPDVAADPGPASSSAPDPASTSAPESPSTSEPAPASTSAPDPPSTSDPASAPASGSGSAPAVRSSGARPESEASVYVSLYDYLSEVIARAPAGSRGVVFTPWLHGNRCPFEDPMARGMFFNISLDTGKTELIRAVVEGVCFHMRWMLEAQERKVKTSRVVRFVGGGALSRTTGQILADVLQREVETVDHPQNAGAVGAAALVGVGLGLIPSLADTKQFIPVARTYRPNPANQAVYDRNYEVFRTLYRNNKAGFARLNG